MFTVEHCKELHKECSIAYKDQHSIRVCYNLAKTYPEQLNMESPSMAERAVAEEVVEVTAAYASLSDVTTGLRSFEYIPAALRGTGLPLFEHMVRRRCIDPKGGVQIAPSILVGDLHATSHQLELLKPTSLELAQR